jgi:hypothetical protein
VNLERQAKFEAIFFEHKMDLILKQFDSEHKMDLILQSTSTIVPIWTNRTKKKTRKTGFEFEIFLLPKIPLRTWLSI